MDQHLFYIELEQFVPPLSLHTVDIEQFQRRRAAFQFLVAIERAAHHLNRVFTLVIVKTNNALHFGGDDMVPFRKRRQVAQRDENDVAGNAFLHLLI